MALVNSLVAFFQDMTPGGVGIWTGVIAFLTYWGKQTLEERKLSSSDRQARREGFEKQVQILQDENRDLRIEMAADRKAHADYRNLCHQETDQLRQQVIRLEDELNGYKRQVDTRTIYALRSPEPDPE